VSHNRSPVFYNFLFIKKRSIAAIWGFSCCLVQSEGSYKPFVILSEAKDILSLFVILSKAKDLL